MNENITAPRYVFSIDRINILFKDMIYDVHRTINFKNLKSNKARYARSLKLIPASEQSRMRGYHTQLIVVLPKPELLEELTRSIGNHSHIVFSIELACDRLYQNKAETITKKRQLIKVLRKMWSQGVRIFDAAAVHEDEHNAAESVPRPQRTTDPEHEHELFGDETLYVGGNLECKVYTRLSKITGQPCVHCEWKIKKSVTVRKQTSVHTIRDLARLDFERTFLNLYRKYIRYEEIDHEKHGRFIQNMTAKSTRPGMVKIGADAARRKAQPDKASRLYIRLNEIRSSAQLRKHYADQKKELLRKTLRRETLTTTETRIKRLSVTRLNSFFRSLPDQFFEEENE